MGNLAWIANPCDACAKYVCNDAKCHSRCCKCCELDVETHATEIADGSDVEFQADLWGAHVTARET